jgi:DNA helicase HerA-like ATPase
MFKPQEMDALPDVLGQFMDSDSAVMRISMKNLSYTLHVREIVANAIGRLLLRSARADRFREQPAVVVLDEAHQFLNKSLGAEHSRYPLDAFELIAKEGRKYSLTVCLCTQRPGDIPEGVLSQVGTQIVHRLVNRSDREAVEQGITHLDHSAARFLPGFAPGEAVIVGTNLSVPLSVQMLPPNQLPDSGGADYDRYWRAA